MRRGKGLQCMTGTTKLDSFDFLIIVRLPSNLLLSLPTKQNHLSLVQVYHVTVTVRIV